MQETNFTYSELAKIAGSATHKTISKCITRKSSEIGEILGILNSRTHSERMSVLYGMYVWLADRLLLKIEFRIGAVPVTVVDWLSGGMSTLCEGASLGP